MAKLNFKMQNIQQENDEGIDSVRNLPRSFLLWLLRLGKNIKVSNRIDKPAKNKENKEMLKRKLLIILIILIVIGLLGYGLAYYFYQQYKSLKSPEEQLKKETAEVVAAVSELMYLPEGETPTLATVLDKEKLKDQPFFKNAENGDKVLIFTREMKAILYRPSTNKIIEVMPISMSQPPPPPQEEQLQPPSQEQPPSEEEPSSEEQEKPKEEQKK